MDGCFDVLRDKVLHYLNSPQTTESRTKRQQKLHEISAEVFVKRVVDFYQDCQTELVANSEAKPRLFSRRSRS